MIRRQEDYIAIVRVEGTIQEQTQSSALETSSGYQHDSTMNYIDELMDDSENKGILAVCGFSGWNCL